jgi:hypothetical protein
MNDLKTLHDAWGTPEGPAHTAYTDARAALLARATPRRRRRARLRVAVVATAAAIVAAFVLVVQDLREGPVAAAEVFERAAHAAETKSFVAPRPDQWIFTEDRFTSSDGGKPMTRKMWLRVDGRGIATIDARGKLNVEVFDSPGRRRPAPFDSYERLAKLPTDPDALLRWAYEQAKHITGGGVTDHGDVYLQFNHMLRSNLLPPDLQAAIYRALKQVPNVTVETIDVFGRPALALVQTEDWLREELLLDPDTYAYLGERSTVVRDTRISPEKAGNATGEVRRGDHVISERVTAAIVEEPGARP